MAPQLYRLTDYYTRGFDLHVECRACRHEGELDAMWIARLRLTSGRSDRMAVVTPLLVCTSCGERRARVTPIPRREARDRPGKHTGFVGGMF
jgi:hypothetical protein